MTTVPQPTPDKSILHVHLFFSPSECRGLCQHRPGHSLGEKIDEHVECSRRCWLGDFTQ